MPEPESMRAILTMLWHRDGLAKMAATNINRMQKALDQMHCRLFASSPQFEDFAQTQQQLCVLRRRSITFHTRDTPLYCHH
jgi:hypothetical protein